jgi:hypothetical protein
MLSPLTIWEANILTEIRESIINETTWYCSQKSVIHSICIRSTRDRNTAISSHFKVMLSVDRGLVVYLRSRWHLLTIEITRKREEFAYVRV